MHERQELPDNCHRDGGDDYHDGGADGDGDGDDDDDERRMIIAYDEC